MDDVDPRPAPPPPQPTDGADAPGGPAAAERGRPIVATPRDAQRLAALRERVNAANAEARGAEAAKELAHVRGQLAADEYAALARRYGMPADQPWLCQSEPGGPVPEGVFYNPQSGQVYTRREPPVALVPAPPAPSPAE